MFLLRKVVVQRINGSFLQSLQKVQKYSRIDFRLFQFRKSESDIQKAQRQAQNIPDAQLSSSVIDWLCMGGNYTLLERYMNSQQLRGLQKSFYQNLGSAKQAYLYFKELNRQKKYGTVIRLYQENKSLFLFGGGEVLQQEEPWVSQVQEQFQIAEQSLLYQGTQFSQGVGGQFYSGGFSDSQQKVKSSRRRQFLFYLFLMLFLFDINPFSFSVEVVDSSEEGSGGGEQESEDFPSSQGRIFENYIKRLKRFLGFGEDSQSKRSVQDKEQGEQDEQDVLKKKSVQPTAPSVPKKENFINRIFNRGQEIQEEKNIKTRFSDVLGIDEFKEELTELVDYLKNPQKYFQAGAKLPKGILLVGPPGTGKTLLARALAGESSCAFFYKTGSEFDEMFVGVGASRVRELFKKAREKAPSIIFIDEIDSVAGTRRSADPGHSRDTVNQILSEMDGFKQSDNVVVIGATNFEQSIDPAIKRPGRFDKIIHVPLPDIRGREQIFEYYLKNIKFEQDVKAKELARQTSGFSGADIQNMVNLAILNAIKMNKTEAGLGDFDHALDRISMGVGRKNMLISDKDKLITAYHEGGHTLTALLTQGATPLHKVTILPRGGALGFTSMIPETDRLNYTKKSMIANIDVAMGGRAAEEIFLGNDEITTGCSSDLSKATEIAYQYVKTLGMMEEYSLISIQNDRIKTSEKYDYEVDRHVQKILKDSYERVKKLLRDNEKKLQNLASELIKHETLTAEEIKQICNQGKLDKKIL